MSSFNTSQTTLSSQHHKISTIATSNTSEIEITSATTGRRTKESHHHDIDSLIAQAKQLPSLSPKSQHETVILLLQTFVSMVNTTSSGKLSQHPLLACAKTDPQFAASLISNLQQQVLAWTRARDNVWVRRDVALNAHDEPGSSDVYTTYVQRMRGIEKKIKAGERAVKLVQKAVNEAEAEKERKRKLTVTAFDVDEGRERQLVLPQKSPQGSTSVPRKRRRSDDDGGRDDARIVAQRRAQALSMNGMGGASNPIALD